MGGGVTAWVLGLALVLLLLSVFRRAVGKLLGLAARTGLGLGVLALLKTVGGAVGLSLGVNLPNALVLALLGAPGLGLLMMLNWVTGL